MADAGRAAWVLVLCLPRARCIMRVQVCVDLTHWCSTVLEGRHCRACNYGGESRCKMQLTVQLASDSDSRRRVRPGPGLACAACGHREDEDLPAATLGRRPRCKTFRLTHICAGTAQHTSFDLIASHLVVATRLGYPKSLQPTSCQQPSSEPSAASTVSATSRTTTHQLIRPAPRVIHLTPPL